MGKKSLLTSVCVITLLLILALPAQAAHSTFYFEKVCDGSIAPNVCVIQAAVAPFEALNGGTIEYNDHAFIQNPAGIIIESATILVTASDGSQAPGHIRWVNSHGYFTLLPGTGIFDDVHMTGNVNILSWETMTFSVSGMYFSTP